MIDVYPTKFEAYDEDLEIFTVTMFDECGAELKLETIVNVKLWDEIAPMIRECLVKMEFKGDKK